MAIKGRAFLGLEIAKDALRPLRRIKGAITEFRKSLFTDIARYWHTEIFPKHFTPGAETRYGYEERTEWYKKKKFRYGKGQGRYVMNIFSGKSLRWMMTTARFTATGQSATVHMPAPAYFTRPFIGTIQFKSGKTMTITRQPDKPREVTRVNMVDIQKMQRFGAMRIHEILNRSMKAA